MNKLFFLFIFLISGVVYAQPELGECTQEVDETAAKQIPRALKNWKTGNYREAERYLKQAVNLDENYADALYLLGDLYVKTLKLSRAEAAWTKLLEVCPDYKPEVYYFLGTLLLENGKRDDAIINFDKFLNHPERDRGYEPEVKKAKKEAILLNDLLGNPVVFNPKPVKGISTTEDEYLGVISPDQELLFFTRRAMKTSSRDGPAARQRLVEEFSMAERQSNNQFSQGNPLPNPFNTSFNEGGPSITANNTELYFTVCEDINGYQNCDIYYSERTANSWTAPQSVGDHINRRDSWESQPSVSANGDILYFASNREGGMGGLDLYICKRKEDGTWSKPENAGAPINTRKDEKTPFIHSDSKTIYFTSNGQMGLGGFDIYYARANDTGAWQEPQNIGYPINSEDDDLGLFVSLDGKTGYFASNKLRTNMGWDMYQFDLPAKVQPKAVTLITGRLTNENNEADEEASLEVKNLKTKEVTKIEVDKETGNYARVVEARPKEDLILTVKKKGAAFSSKYISVGDVKTSTVVKAPFEIKPLEVGKEYTLNDINFPTNSYQLDEVSRAVIDEFILFLQENPSLKADIQGHTDNVGNSGDNLALSKNRAKTVFDYVLAQGVGQTRLSHHGYGETKPLGDNNTESGKAQNRRTVFVITSR